METFLGTAAVAALSGLTWLAYSDPVGYARIGFALGFSLMLAGIAGFIFNSGVVGGKVKTRQRLHQRRVEYEVIQDAMEAADDALMPLRWLVVVYVAGFYLTALDRLPDVMGRHVNTATTTTTTMVATTTTLAAPRHPRRQAP